MGTLLRISYCFEKHVNAFIFINMITLLQGLTLCFQNILNMFLSLRYSNKHLSVFSDNYIQIRQHNKTIIFCEAKNEHIQILKSILTVFMFCASPNVQFEYVISRQFIQILSKVITLTKSSVAVKLNWSFTLPISLCIHVIMYPCHYVSMLLRIHAIIFPNHYACNIILYLCHKLTIQLSIHITIYPYHYVFIYLYIILSMHPCYQLYMSLCIRVISYPFHYVSIYHVYLCIHIINYICHYVSIALFILVIIYPCHKLSMSYIYVIIY